MVYNALTACLERQGDGYGLPKDSERTPEQWAAYLSGRWMLMSRSAFEAELLPLFKEIQRMGDELAVLKAKQKINSRTVETILGHNRFLDYLKVLKSETGLDRESIVDAEFLISRGVNFVGGSFTDLGCANVVVYCDKYLDGYSIVVRDRK